VNKQRTFAGLDVHARSVTGHAMDEWTGEVWQRRLPADPAEVRRWLQSLPQPVRAAYEAGPTGYGLARVLNSGDIACSVAAPSKLQRPPGYRIKTDARDAEHLCRLLRLGEIVEVRVPSLEQEQARDLVRAREDVRGDLMRARHRVSKMLLRQGMVYPGSKTWTGLHHRWLRQQHFDAPAQQLAYQEYVETVVLTTDRRDRLERADRGDGRRQQLHRAAAAAVLSAWHLHPDRVWVGGGDRGLAPFHRFLHWCLLGAGAY
jgi:transposase